LKSLTQNDVLFYKKGVYSMQFDHLFQPYASQRSTVFARNGIVATSQPLASQAGLEMLKKGGNAIDAAIATAAALTVVEPTSNGIGGDAFALVWSEGKLHGLNASGPAPRAISIDVLKDRGFEKIPVHGVVPITVPGVPAAWAELSKKFGKLPFTEVLEPAIRYADEGYPLTPILGKFWKLAYKKFKNIFTTDEFQPWFDTFAPEGRAPEIGEMWKSPGHASTLRSIADTYAESFYQGELADKIVGFLRKHGGFLEKDDMATYEVDWVDPISVNYRGYDVWEIPPNGQGIVALMALQIAKGYEFSSKEDAEALHRQIEAMKLAFTDGKAFVTEKAEMRISVEELLSEQYAEARRKKIGTEAIEPAPYQPPKGGTVYLAAADSEGNMVSFIQSNYMGFGSGIVIPDTGIALQNRGHDFSLDKSHPNALKPGKKTYHTIIPGFLTKDGEAVGPFGVMGGYMQPQGHFQVVMNTIDFHLNPQAALDAPRWQWIEGKKVLLEPNFPNHLAQALARKGHDVQLAVDSGSFGRGQIIWRDPKTGVLMGGTESRTDGSIAAY
jgi:gamma-glutamyltranspeptidase/glutathione hydrolase